MASTASANPSCAPGSPAGRAYRLVWKDVEQRALDDAASRELITSAWKGFTNV